MSAGRGRRRDGWCGTGRAGLRLGRVGSAGSLRGAARSLSGALPPRLPRRLQPNCETRQKQLSAWCALALAYSQRHRLPAMTVREAQDSPLFTNRRLQRILWGPAPLPSRPLPPCPVRPPPP